MRSVGNVCTQGISSVLQSGAYMYEPRVFIPKYSSVPSGCIFSGWYVSANKQQLPTELGNVDVVSLIC